MVNHRIEVEDSVQIVKDHYVRFLVPLANKWSFNFKGFGAEKTIDPSTSRGTIALTSTYDLEPSPVSDHEDPRFSWLTGTIRGVFGKEVIVAPVLLTGTSVFIPFDWFYANRRKAIPTRGGTGTCHLRYIECHHGNPDLNREERICILWMKECPLKGFWRW